MGKDNKVLSLATDVIGNIGLTTMKSVSEHMPDTITIDLLEAKKRVSMMEKVSDVRSANILGGIHVSTQYKDAKKKELVSNMIKEILGENRMINVTPKK